MEPETSGFLSKGLDHVCEFPLDSPKEIGAAEEEPDRNNYREACCLQPNGAASQRGPAKHFDKPHCRIEAVDRLPFWPNKAGAVNDGAGKHPDLDQKWDRVHKIAVLHR